MKKQAAKSSTKRDRANYRNYIYYGDYKVYMEYRKDGMQ